MLTIAILASALAFALCAWLIRTLLRHVDAENEKWWISNGRG